MKKYIVTLTDDECQGFPSEGSPEDLQLQVMGPCPARKKERVEVGARPAQSARAICRSRSEWLRTRTTFTKSTTGTGHES